MLTVGHIFCAWLAPMIAIFYMSEQCGKGWRGMWTYCNELSDVTVEWNAIKFTVVTKAGLCTGSEFSQGIFTAMSSFKGGCARKLISTMTNLILPQLALEATLFPAFYIFTWIFSKPVPLETCLTAGDLVVVMKTFYSDDQNEKVALPEGETGKVEKIDKHGHALIKFDSFSEHVRKFGTLQQDFVRSHSSLVLKKHFNKLRKVDGEQVYTLCLGGNPRMQTGFGKDDYLRLICVWLATAVAWGPLVPLTMPLLILAAIISLILHRLEYQMKDDESADASAASSSSSDAFGQKEKHRAKETEEEPPASDAVKEANVLKKDKTDLALSIYYSIVFLFGISAFFTWETQMFSWSCPHYH
jgi:hypothetical protein